jgi:hydroxymethylbilane synthase
MTKRRLRIGSRGSRLALAQTELVCARLRELYPEIAFEVEVIKTLGDVARTASLSAIGGKGVFTKEIEEALLAARIDLAVHSLKDLPTTLPRGLKLGAILEREDPRDALIARAKADGSATAHLRALRSGAVIGTSSLRRLVQVKRMRADLEVREIRGNVDTRLRKLDEESYDAIILAAAGLNRLQLAHRITALFSTDEMLPAVGQGALAIEIRAADLDLERLLAPLDHGPTRCATAAERAFLRALGGGCRLPIAAHARCEGERLLIEGMIASADGAHLVRSSLEGRRDQAEAIGERLAEKIKEASATDLSF